MPPRIRSLPISIPGSPKTRCPRLNGRRSFHDYFVTHLPSTSMHPDSRSMAGRHNLPRSSSSPASPGGSPRSPSMIANTSRDTTVVRIPLKSAKHHYGVACSRGTRPYNEDTYQAGTIELPAFAKRAPMSVRSGPQGAMSAESASGDPQVFYFGVFDGHGGDKCSIWLREKLHWYLEESAAKFGLQSTLPRNGTKRMVVRKKGSEVQEGQTASQNEAAATAGSQDQKAIDAIGPQQTLFELAEVDSAAPADGDEDAITLQTNLVKIWGDTVGGYFRRFKPEYFAKEAGGQGEVLYPSTVRNGKEIAINPMHTSMGESARASDNAALESVLSYSFLRADLDFVTAHSSLNSTHTDTSKDTSAEASTPAADSSPSSPQDKPSQPFLGGSTCSVALISTPGPIPFWHPSSPFTIATTHVGDTRIILCATTTGAPIPVTTTHHPSTPAEEARLRRYAAAFTTDSFGEERLTGLANTRSFGDRRSKRVGVSAEPHLTLLHAKPAEFSFLVLVTDGVTGPLSDQEIVDVVKEARTPEQAAKDVVSLAVEIAGGEQGQSDNATCQVVRLGGWERRMEGGGGSLGTKEAREQRRNAASDPRAGRR